jgi:hypothetical protein
VGILLVDHRVRLEMELNTQAMQWRDDFANNGPHAWPLVSTRIATELDVAPARIELRGCAA